MPHIIVMADGDISEDGGAVMLRERINVSDLECESFGARLLERLNWAVEDAQQLERGDDQVTEAVLGVHPRPTRTSRPSRKRQPSAGVVTTAS